jgi:hypothetical protein
VDPTADIKDTFISESLFDAFERFEQALAEHVEQSSSKVKISSGGMQTQHAQCSYRLDTNTPRPVIRVTIASGDNKPIKHEFVADTVGSGILNMRLVWRDQSGGQLLSSVELAEFCFNELVATSPVA